MANVQPLFINASGYPEEMTDSDAIDLGALAMTGNITFSSGTVTGLPLPTNPTEAASKQYVDNVAMGLDPKNSARLTPTVSLVGAGWIAAGSGVGATLTSPTNATSNNDFDGVTSVLNDRILVRLDGADSGIYYVSQLATGAVPTVLTRALDFDGSPAGEVTSGAYLWVTRGNTLAETAWVLTTDDPITIDTTSQTWAQFYGISSLIAGAGLSLTGQTLDVELSATPGLEFDAGGVSGRLQVKVDPAGAILRQAAGISVNQGNGLEINANVLEVDLAATNPCLSFDGGGGVQVDVNALGALDKTATGLLVRVDGSSITINGSNQLQAISAPASRVEQELQVSEAINPGDAVCWDPANANQLREARANDNARVQVIGVSEDTIAASGIGTIVRRGVALGVLVGATANTPYFVDTAGGISSTVPGSNNHVVRVGYAKNATDLEVIIEYVGKKA